MGGHYGKNEVYKAWRKQPKKTTVGHYRRTSGDTFAAVINFSGYVYPVTEKSGLSGSGASVQSTTIVLYQMGETYAPSAEDKLVDSTGRTWLIDSLNSRMNEDANWGIHDCTVYSMS